MTRFTKHEGPGERPEVPANAPRQPVDPAELRRIAEGRVALLPRTMPDGTAQVEALLHELQVHQIELEMQNEALQARLEAEENLARYTDLYELAPVAYFTLRRDGSIHQMNFAGATLIGLPPGRLSGQRLGAFVASDMRAAFNAFLERVFAQSEKAVLEVTFQPDGRPELVAHVEAVADSSGAQCRLGATDITGLKRTEQALRESEERLRLALLGANDGWWDWRLTSDEFYLTSGP